MRSCPKAGQGNGLLLALSLLITYFFDYQRHGQHVMLTSQDHLDGAKSFIEKRPPKFKGE